MVLSAPESEVSHDAPGLWRRGMLGNLIPLCQTQLLVLIASATSQTVAAQERLVECGLSETRGLAELSSSFAKNLDQAKRTIRAGHRAVAALGDSSPGGQEV